MPTDGGIVVFGLDVLCIFVNKGELSLEEGGVVGFAGSIGHRAVLMVEHGRREPRLLLGYKGGHDGQVTDPRRWISMLKDEVCTLAMRRDGSILLDPPID
jgi:hypothetical protein